MALLRGVLGVAGVLLVLTPTVTARQAPSVDDLRRLGGEYFEKYSTSLSGVSMQEQLMLIETTGGNSKTPQRLLSDVVFITVDKRVIGLRDPLTIDSRRLRDPQPRIVQALTNPTQASWALVQKYVRENLGLLLHNVVVWFVDPALALQFIAPANQGRLTYKLEGAKKMNGVQVYGLGFKEPNEGPPVFNEVPGDARAAGRFWIDPTNGAIHMTELWVQSKTDNVRMQVQYAPDKTLALLLPRRATHTFEWRELGSDTDTIGRSQMKLSFESSAEYGKATFTAIDLTRVK